MARPRSRIEAKKATAKVAPVDLSVPVALLSLLILAGLLLRLIGPWAL